MKVDLKNPYTLAAMAAASLSLFSSAMELAVGGRAPISAMLVGMSSGFALMWMADLFIAVKRQAPLRDGTDRIFRRDRFRVGGMLIGLACLTGLLGLVSGDPDLGMGEWVVIVPFSLVCAVLCGAWNGFLAGPMFLWVMRQSRSRPMR